MRQICHSWGSRTSSRYRGSPDRAWPSAGPGRSPIAGQLLLGFRGDAAEFVVVDQFMDCTMLTQIRRCGSCVFQLAKSHLSARKRSRRPPKAHPHRRNFTVQWPGDSVIWKFPAHHLPQLGTSPAGAAPGKGNDSVLRHPKDRCRPRTGICCRRRRLARKHAGIVHDSGWESCQFRRLRCRNPDNLECISEVNRVLKVG